LSIDQLAIKLKDAPKLSSCSLNSRGHLVQLLSPRGIGDVNLTGSTIDYRIVSCALVASVYREERVLKCPVKIRQAEFSMIRRAKGWTVQALSVKQDEFTIGLPIGVARNECSLMSRELDGLFQMSPQFIGRVLSSRASRRVACMHLVVAIRAEGYGIGDVVGAAFFGSDDVVHLDAVKALADCAHASSPSEQIIHIGVGECHGGG
jgi:hypothetical protein